MSVAESFREPAFGGRHGDGIHAGIPGRLNAAVPQIGTRYLRRRIGKHRPADTLARMGKKP